MFDNVYKHGMQNFKLIYIVRRTIFSVMLQQRCLTAAFICLKFGKQLNLFKTSAYRSAP